MTHIVHLTVYLKSHCTGMVFWKSSCRLSTDRSRPNGSPSWCPRISWKPSPRRVALIVLLSHVSLTIRTVQQVHPRLRHAPAESCRPSAVLAAAESVSMSTRIIRALTCAVSTVEVDILKPDTGVVTIERPLHSSSKGSSSRAGTSGQTTPERMQYTEPVSEGEDEEMDMAPGKHRTQQLRMIRTTHSPCS